MTVQALERKLGPLEEPVANPLLRWLYLHLPLQPMVNRKRHQAYAKAAGILMAEREKGTLDGSSRRAIATYLRSVIPFIVEYEKKEFPIGSASAEEVMRFLME